MAKPWPMRLHTYMSKARSPRTRLEEIMFDRGVRQVDVVMATGETADAVSKVVRGANGVSAKWAALTAQLLAVPIEAILSQPLGAPIPPRPKGGGDCRCATEVAKAFPPRSHDDAFEEAARLVALMLEEERLPTDPGSVARACLEVWRAATEARGPSPLSERIKAAIADKRRAILALRAERIRRLDRETD